MYESWLNQGGLQRLTTAAPACMEAAGLDPERFRQLHFGPKGSKIEAKLTQKLARDLQVAIVTRSDEHARGAAGRSLARLARETGRGGLNRATASPTPSKPSAPLPNAEFDPRWVKTTEAALRDLRSQAYDNLIRQELADYNRRFAATPGFVPLDFRIFKALLLVESGGHEKLEWTTRPYQIGNPIDPGYGVLQRRTEGSALIMSQQLFDDISKNPGNNPELNIRAGIAYVLTRMVATQIMSYVSPTDQTLHTHIVEAGDSLDRISRRVGTTVENLRQNNPILSGNLQPGQRLVFHKMESRSVISGWRSINPTTLMDRYNGNRDSLYARKITFGMGLMK